MNRTIAMTFGDRVYDVPMAPIKRAKAWRAQLRAPIDSLMGVLSTDLTVELSAITDVVTLVNKVLPALLDAPETLLQILEHSFPPDDRPADRHPAQGRRPPHGDPDPDARARSAARP